MRYTTLLFDLDHTLFDFDTSELHAFEAALAVVGIDEHTAHLPTYQRLNTSLWAAAERGEIRSTDIRDLRFARLCDELGLDVDRATVVAMADAFVHGLGAHGGLYPGALDVLDAVTAAGATVAIVSNGLGEVVHARLARLDLTDRFDAVVVSSEVGVSKPHAGIFDAAFAALDRTPGSDALMIGDSLTSDIAGGAAYGLDTAWLNRSGARTGLDPGLAEPPFTYELTALSQLPPILHT